MRRTAIASTIGLLLLVTAVPADAQPHVTYRTKTFTVGAHQTKTVDVPCPTGRHAFGGGATGPSKVHLTRSSLADSGLEPWTVAVNNTSGQPQTVKAFATCWDLYSPTSGSSTVLGSSTTVPAGGTTTYTTTCTSGRKTLGGGFNLETADPSVLIQASKPTAANDGWTVAVMNPDATGVTLTYFSFCLSGWAPTEVDASKDVAQNRSATETAKCPSGQVISGGFDMSQVGYSTVNKSKPSGLAASPPGTGWTVGGRTAVGAPDTLTAYAECLPF